jgi:hypothetical protein
MSLRYRKEPDETGLARAVQGPRGYELRDGEEVVMRVAPLTGRDRYTIYGWYVYGLGINTVGIPVATADEAKEFAKSHAKKHYRGKP